MHTRLRGVELWMKRKNLPRSYRHRVRQYERQRWAATRGVDECRIVRDLPEGLRRDIKYHLCLGLVRQVRSKHTHRHRSFVAYVMLVSFGRAATGASRARRARN
jgi:hypothetical protein